jgi:CDP-glycerol glycerophosphotransferase
MGEKPIRDAPEFAHLANVILKCCAGSTAAYFPNSGNWGDSLIRGGAISFFQRYEIPFTVVYKKQFKKKKKWRIFSSKKRDLLNALSRKHSVAIYGGGGAWCTSGAGGRDVVQVLSRHFERVIVLPTTFELPGVGDCVTYFCRDRFESQKYIAQSTFCHDMAFQLEPPTLEPTEDIGLFFRTDKESHYRKGGTSGNFDLSRMGDELSDVALFFVEVGRFRDIVTDRLHVAIAAALLGRPTYLLRGAYWKNASVYRSSLQEHFPNVRFVESLLDLPKHISSRLELGA